MADKRKELNSLINKMYRQLGKDLYDDLNKDRFRVDRYQKFARKIDHVIQAYHGLEEVEALEEDDDKKVISLPVKGSDGLYQYRFCPECNAGNNPDATHCIRCKSPLN